MTSTCKFEYFTNLFGKNGLLDNSTLSINNFILRDERNGFTIINNLDDLKRLIKERDKSHNFHEVILEDVYI
jgi:hypothetical protein